MLKNVLTGSCLLGAALLCTAPVATSADDSKTFDKSLELDGISFHVVCANEGSLNDVTIVPSGLKEVNEPITIKYADGSVYGAEVADLNRDGSPEIYVYVTSAGSGSYGSLIAYSANNRKSLSPIYLPPLEEDKIHAKGYMGHDSFAVRDGHLIRSFPVYREGDVNANPGGGTRELEYILIPGEASWQLQLTRSTDR